MAGPVGFEPTIFGSPRHSWASEPDVLSWLSSPVQSRDRRGDLDYGPIGRARF